MYARHSVANPQFTLSVRLLGWLLLALLLSGCSMTRSRPDLERIYADLSEDPEQPPIILIHGLMGSTLVAAETGEQVWPGTLSTMAFSEYRRLIPLDELNTEALRLVPGKLFTEKAGVDFYASLIETLERIGHFKRGTPGEPVSGDGRRYYVMLYDWRRDNLIAVRQLHELIEQIRRDYRNPRQRVDIVAHSNGGLIANYYLRFGARDVLGSPAPTVWHEGSRRIRKLVRMGTPQLGSASSLERLINGMRLGVRTIPAEVLASFSTPFEALPTERLGAVIDTQGNPIAIDLFDPSLWRRNRWSVFDPAVVARVAQSYPSPELGERAIAQLQAAFERHLRRAAQLRDALAVPLPDQGTEQANFGGDCTQTQAHAVLVHTDQRDYLAFRPRDIDSKVAGLDYSTMLFEPGDGLVTRRSQIGDAMDEVTSINRPQNIFLCEQHQHLTGNPFFRNNLLLFLLGH